MTNTIWKQNMDHLSRAPTSPTVNRWPAVHGKSKTKNGIWFVAIFALILMSISSLSHAVTLNIATSSTPGKFDVSYNSNNRYYVFILEISPDSSAMVVQTDSGTPTSGSVTVTKANGTYGYRLRLCDRMTGGFAGNCSYTATRSVTVNTSSTGGAVALGYSYDALGRLIQTKKNSAIRSSYCYDDAGNRLLVSEGGSGSDPCAEHESPALSAPGDLSAFPHAYGGYVINWSVVEGATYYRLQLSNNTLITINNIFQTTYYTNSMSETPLWVQACGSSQCSTKAYF